MKKYYIVVLSLLLFSACNDWFDVAPKEDYIDEEALFSSESAFRNAMNGIYTEIRDRDLYGANLTLGGVEFLGQTFVPDEALKPISDFNYESSLVRGMASGIWVKMYHAIYSCNNLTRLLQKKKEVVFVEGSREMMLAELKALRATLHYELVRLFHPSVTADANFKGVVWMEGTKAEPLSLTNLELVTKIVQEFTAAIDELKKYDPISTGESYNTDALFGTKPADRVWKMNYYAALGMKARVSLVLGTSAGYTDARSCADAIIDDGYFAFATTAGTDLGFSVEHLWGLAPADKDFSVLSNELFAERGIPLSDVVDAASWKASAADDLRFKWFKTDLVSMLPKFDSTSLVKDSETSPRIPMIKLGEAYLIAAEAALQQSDLAGAYGYLSTFINKRFSRTTLTEHSTPEEFRAEIRTQYVREFLGEGQLFYNYKRWNLSSIPSYTGGSTDMTAAKYTWPIPVN
ncbi:RagB/SusD family nutrient uptake outer membrane protein [Butyricimonas hominis]|uniref:RagB/SusD family nutrient uptake outer membrane protein n=1 Tax=Butyricimonas hominis TaxID=2763032 RepID=A0ABR7CXL4_9BACT|nr:RagB/SusD family nutrient uptake outer membrane protein [Butyricimonas hominis]MBC5620344.1 RagB/SusD family nutrient uptake outer membrane protein [Butyricimonas hominis]